MAKGILFILLLSFLGCKSDIATNRHIQHGYIDLQFYLDSSYHLAADTIVYTPQNKGEGVLRYHYVNSKDTNKGLFIIYWYQTNKMRHPSVYGSLEEKYANLESHLQNQHQPCPYKIKLKRINDMRCIVASHWTDGRPIFKGYVRYDEFIAVDENIGLITLSHYDNNYNPVDSIQSDQSINSIFKAIVIKENKNKS